MTEAGEPAAYRIAETGQCVNAVELELHFQFGLWTVLERSEERWLVRDQEGQQLTLVPTS